MAEIREPDDIGGVSEVKEGLDSPEQEMDEGLSKELDAAYDSYITESDGNHPERSLDKAEDAEDAEDAPEEADDLESEQDEKYDAYMRDPSALTRGRESDDVYNDYADAGEKESPEGLTEAEKAQLKAETGWSDEIVNSTRSLEEAEVYKRADLKEAEIDGKKCLIRGDLDMEQRDEFGRTNKERMENGNPPLTRAGQTVELHHIGQKQDSPLAELTMEEHRGKGNDAILHDKTKETEINRAEFAKERKHHWESRGENLD